MGITITIEKSHMYVLLAIVVLFTSILLVESYGGNNPVFHGHDSGELVETDPTVPGSIKDGIAWSEISSIPGAFADGIDNTMCGDTCNGDINFGFANQGIAFTAGGRIDENANMEYSSAAAHVFYGSLLTVQSTVQITNTNTGGNFGTDICIDSSNRLCKCGSCS